MTDEHPFYVAGRGWTPARELVAGDRLLTPAGEESTVLANAGEVHPDGVTVYNLEVQDAHTYFVRAEGSVAEPVWVHNAPFERYASAAEVERFRAAGNKFTIKPGHAKNPVRVAPRGTVNPRALKSSAEKAAEAYYYKIEFDLSDDAAAALLNAGVPEAIGHPGSFAVPAQQLDSLNSGISKVLVKIARGRKV